MKAPYFTYPTAYSSQPYNNVPVSGVGEPRTNVSICIANHGYEMASVFCDEFGKFSATLVFTTRETLSITAKCVLSSESSDWGPTLAINLT
jgi:hypothetical protein